MEMDEHGRSPGGVACTSAPHYARLVAEGSGPNRAAEEAFIARLKARDETAFNELVELYQQLSLIHI